MGHPSDAECFATAEKIARSLNLEGDQDFDSGVGALFLDQDAGASLERECVAARSLREIVDGLQVDREMIGK